MKYDGINWMGWLIIITILSFILFVYLMWFGKWGIPIFIGVVIGGIIIGANKEEKDIKIEFIGDSITCGYGIDEMNEKGYFSTATENFTKSYAYITAENLGAAPGKSGCPHCRGGESGGRGTCLRL